MTCRRRFSWTFFSLCAGASLVRSEQHPLSAVMPPTTIQELRDQVDGRLYAGLPFSQPCYDEFDSLACKAIQAGYKNDSESICSCDAMARVYPIIRDALHCDQRRARRVDDCGVVEAVEIMGSTTVRPYHPFLGTSVCQNPGVLISMVLDSTADALLWSVCEHKLGDVPGTMERS